MKRTYRYGDGGERCYCSLADKEHLVFTNSEKIIHKAQLAADRLEVDKTFQASAPPAPLQQPTSSSSQPSLQPGSASRPEERLGHELPTTVPGQWAFNSILDQIDNAIIGWVDLLLPLLIANNGNGIATPNTFNENDLDDLHEVQIGKHFHVTCI